jgi:hypothetical protein
VTAPPVTVLLPPNECSANVTIATKAIDLTAMSKIRARQIGESDVPAVAELLARGFDARPQQLWVDVFARLAERPIPPGTPRYGYLLESDGATVGAILLIFSSLRRGDASTIRCNVSSWFVEPAYRVYASLLVCKAFSHKNATYLNITPAPHTLPSLVAQGYSQYSGGIFVAVPALQFRACDADVKVVQANTPVPTQADPIEHNLLVEHAKYGCLSLWCMVAGRASPFVFRLRRFKRIVPCAQLIYSRSVDDFVEMAGPIGRFLAARGRALVVIDANGPIVNLVGKYLTTRQPKYFRGPNKPRLGDLLYTEAAMFGI